MTFHKILVKELADIRRQRKLTQADVAGKMNTTASAIARFEAAGGKRGHSPSLKTLTAYAGAIGVKIEIKVKTND